MFCDRCGTTLAPGAQYCASCGKVVIPTGTGPAATGSPSSGTAGGRVQRHIQLLAGLWLANGVLRLLEVGWMVFMGRMIFPAVRGWMGPMSWPLRGWGFDSLFMTSLYSAGVLLAGFGIVHLILAWGLFERQPWARLLGLVIGFLAMLRFPLGTALGIYTIWVLLPESSAREYASIARPA
jgi:hypothetical protein